MSLRNLLSLVLVFAALTGFSQIREKQNFNKNWKFSLSDNAEFGNPDFDDSSWRILNLPHDWSIESEFSEKNSGRNAWLPGGIAWYRKSFKVEKTDEGRHFEIQFDGIYRHSKIWVNGVFIGTQYDGYTSFYFDITEALKFGETNEIAVRVDNSVQPNCRWYSGSGIYRNVWLTKTNPLHVKNWGTYITTSQVSKRMANVKVEISIENLDFEEKEFVLETTILNALGEQVAKIESPQKMGAQRSSNIQQKLKVADPALWSVDAPNLYTAISKLKINGEVIDNYTSNFGIRTIEFNAKKGFFLNGENLKMKGVCLHHEAGAFGAAVPVEIWERRLQNLKAIGCNAIRTVHNPHAPEFLDLCDKMGFLVMDEFVDKWNNLDAEFEFYAAPFADPYFHTEWQKNFEETIRRDRNHPSVIIWSVGNENHSPGSERQNLGLQRYCNFVRSIDPTRPVISGMERGQDLGTVEEKIDDIIESCSFMDLIAMNYGEQWCELIDAKNPGKPYVSTESYTYFNSSKEKRWANRESNPWLDVIDNDFNMGLFLWVGIGYLGESRTWPRVGSLSGLLDIAGFPTVRAELFEAFWSDKPVLHINIYEGDADDFSTSGKWGCPPMNKTWNLEKGNKYDIATYTNCEEVDLYVNNKKIGTQKLADIPNWIMKWRKVDYKAGKLRAVGKIGGKVVCETEIVTTGEPAKVHLEECKLEKTSNGVIQVEVTLTDKNGNFVQHNDCRLNFEVEGEAEILMLGSGSMTIDEQLQQKESKSTFKGKLLCVLKAKPNMDTIKLVASGEGIQTETLLINVK
jgi:beta-galactosidase